MAELEKIQAFIAKPNLYVGDRVSVPRGIILGNLNADGPQLYALAIDDQRRIWKESHSEEGSTLTLIFDPIQGWM